MPTSLTTLACFSTPQQPHFPSYKAPKLPSTTCGTCRSHTSPCLTTLRLFFSPFRNCLTLDSWPIGTERSVPPPSLPFLMPLHQTLSATSLALLLLWRENILPSLCLRPSVTLTLSVKAFLPPANFPLLQLSHLPLLVVTAFEVSF
jgi:hypothetical protein